jgi:hypothetical protein
MQGFDSYRGRKREVLAIREMPSVNAAFLIDSTKRSLPRFCESYRRFALLFVSGGALDLGLSAVGLSCAWELKELPVEWISRSSSAAPDPPMASLGIATLPSNFVLHLLPCFL